VIALDVLRAIKKEPRRWSGYWRKFGWRTMPGREICRGAAHAMRMRGSSICEVVAIALQAATRSLQPGGRSRNAFVRRGSRRVGACVRHTTPGVDFQAVLIFKEHKKRIGRAL